MSESEKQQKFNKLLDNYKKYMVDLINEVHKFTMREEKINVTLFQNATKLFNMAIQQYNQNVEKQKSALTKLGFKID